MDKARINPAIGRLHKKTKDDNITKKGIQTIPLIKANQKKCKTL